MWVSEIGIQFYSFACEYPVFPTPFIEEIILYSCVFLAPVSHFSWPICMSLFLEFLFCFLIHVSVSLSVSFCFDYYNCIAQFEIRKCDASTCLFFSRLLWLFGIFCCSKWILGFYFCEKCLWNFDGDFIESIDCFG